MSNEHKKIKLKNIRPLELLGGGKRKKFGNGLRLELSKASTELVK